VTTLNTSPQASGLAVRRESIPSSRSSTRAILEEWARASDGTEGAQTRYPSPGIACPLGRALLVHVEVVAGTACDAGGEATDNFTHNADVPWGDGCSPRRSAETFQGAGWVGVCVVLASETTRSSGTPGAIRPRKTM